MKHALRLPPRLLGAAVIAICIVGCGKSNDAAKPATSPPRKETVFDDLIDTKARAKQQTDQAMEQNKQKLDAAMKQVDESGATQ